MKPNCEKKLYETFRLELKRVCLLLRKTGEKFKLNYKRLITMVLYQIYFSPTDSAFVTRHSNRNWLFPVASIVPGSLSYFNEILTPCFYILIVLKSQIWTKIV